MALQQAGTFQPSNRIVSPGVFTREIDQSQIAQSVAAIGGVVVAPFPKGPGFSPTIIRSEADLTSIFGDPDGQLYGPYTAQQYIRQQGQVTIVRVGGLGGYNQRQALFLTAVPGTHARINESGSFTGTMVGATVSSASNGYTINGTLSATFSTGFYSGSTMIVGSTQFIAQNVTQITGSNGTGSLVSGSISATFLTGSLLPHVPTDLLTVSSSFYVSTVSPCRSTLNFTGKITGLYGDFSTVFTAAGTSSEDPCGGQTGSAGTRDETILAVLANTAYDRSQNLYGFSGSILTSVASNGCGTNYRLNLLSSYYNTATGTYVSSSYGTYNFSTDIHNSAYITNVFGTNPQAGYTAVAAGAKLDAAYTYAIFNDAIKNIVAEQTVSGSWQIQAVYRDALTLTDGITPDVGTSTFDLTNAYTPFIRSQATAPFSGSSSSNTGSYHYDLFKVHTLSDGTNTNRIFKVEISNVRTAGTVPGSNYGSFTLCLRDFNDTDKKPLVYERYDNLSLDPDSSNFIARRIGDIYSYFDYNGKILEFGNYKNVSKLIRVEMATSPWPVAALPYGFGPYASPVGGDYARLGKVPVMVYTSASIYASAPGRYASGVQFQPAPSDADTTLAALYVSGSVVGPERDNKQYFSPIPLGAATGDNVLFDLESNCGVTPLYVASDEATNVKKRRFVLGFQGGFDGQSPSKPILTGNDILPTNQQGLDCSTNVAYGSYAYKQALAALSNADEFDFNLITTPGINYQQHPYVVSLTLETCENRGDAFYIFDVAPNMTAGANAIQSVVDSAGNFDTSYAATYYPWVKIVDTNTNKVLPVPPSVVMMSVYAANDKVAAEWFAPAGLNRGGIPAAVQVMDRLSHADRDTLYEGKVNPIASFPGQGIVAWGQKTLQRTPSALDRINVRRLLIALKKFIASSSRYLVFEQNVSSTRNRFLGIVNPYLESVQQRSGLYAFKVIMDASNNTPDLVDRNILYGQIYLQPSKTAEFITLDFNILPTGAVFPGA